MLKIGRYLTKNGSEANVALREETKGGIRFVGHIRYQGFVAWDSNGVFLDKDPDCDDLDIVLDTFQEKEH